MDERFSVSNTSFHFKVLKVVFFNSGQHRSASECASATRQHKGNKEKLGAKPKERINKPNKTEINGSESFQVQTAAVI